MDRQLKVHFMGIGGSGASSIAILAKQKGFIVTGCDCNVSDYYTKALVHNNITIDEGHHKNHLDDVDICAISPAIMDISPNNEEILEAKRRGILMTWQEFMAKYIQTDMNVLSIAGTHGKSTTTILLGVILEDAGLDPNVLSGTTYKSWGKGSRVGTSDYFVCEADEFNKNFLNYESSIAVINNLEMDHPESYASFDDIVDAYKEFVKQLKNKKILIINEESIGTKKLLNDLKDWFVKENITVIGYYINEKFDFPFDKEYQVSIIDNANDHITFEIYNKDTVECMTLNLPGIYNINNAMSTICVAKELGLSSEAIAKGLQKFKGVGRRFELVGTVGDIRIYDDYAHHPTAIRSVLTMCNEIFPGKKIWAIFEPHQISRIELLFDDFTDALNIADQIIVTKTHIGREINKGVKPIAANRWLERFGEKSIYLEEINDILYFVNENIQNDDIIVVFGAANSYRISRSIFDSLTQIKVAEI